MILNKTIYLAGGMGKFGKDKMLDYVEDFYLK